ncbi:MAG: beta-N-acetylhexosaminidase [Bacteroidales bacterium]
MKKEKSTTRPRALFAILIIMIMASCTKQAPSDLSKESIIPKPVSVVGTGEYFTLGPSATICVIGESEEVMKVADFLAGKLRTATGFPLEVKKVTEAPAKGAITLSLSADLTRPGEESYEMDITPKGIKITATAPAGLFYGVQTLRQLLPAAIEASTVQKIKWTVAAGKIADSPVYSYRGAMLDVSRHFFGVDDVKRFIDLISCYKMNVLHLHLSDDQGWRIEIKSWPNLTTHGGSTQVGGGQGGFYTQEQYSDIVKYARDRFMTIVPEIDMPGHTNAALASYAELNADGKARELYTGTEVGFSTLAARKEVTYKFIDDVVREIAAITPGPYFHMGGDESHATKKDDYKLFVEKVQEIVKKNGKVVLGWDEIATTKLTEGAVAQYWAKSENAQLAVKQGSQVLISPADRAYLDMQYDSTTTLGLHWAAYIEVDNGYNWDPATLVPGIGKENILGVEAPLWSETVTRMDDIEYLVFPRLPGIAEIGWTAPESRDWNEYKFRLGKHGARFEAMGIDYYKSKLVPWDVQVVAK